MTKINIVVSTNTPENPYQQIFEQVLPETIETIYREIIKELLTYNELKNTLEFGNDGSSFFEKQMQESRQLEQKIAMRRDQVIDDLASFKQRIQEMDAPELTNQIDDLSQLLNQLKQIEALRTQEAKEMENTKEGYFSSEIEIEQIRHQIAEIITKLTWKLDQLKEYQHQTNHAVIDTLVITEEHLAALKQALRQEFDDYPSDSLERICDCFCELYQSYLALTKVVFKQAEADATQLITSYRNRQLETLDTRIFRFSPERFLETAQRQLRQTALSATKKDSAFVEQYQTNIQEIITYQQLYSDWIQRKGDPDTYQRLDQLSQIMKSHNSLFQQAINSHPMEKSFWPGERDQTAEYSKDFGYEKNKGFSSIQGFLLILMAGMITISIFGMLFLK